MITIQKATTNEDIQKIADLASIIWHEYYTPLLGAEQVEYMVDKFQSYDAMQNGIKNDGYVYYMANLDGAFCGYIGIIDEGEKVFLSKIYIAKDYRGKKIAKAMLAKVAEDYKNAKAFYLTVNRGNTASIDAYKKMGFEIVKEQVADIGNGFVMDDYVMECTTLSQFFK